MNVKRFTCFFRGGHQWVKIRDPKLAATPQEFFLRCSRCGTEDRKTRNGPLSVYPGQST